MLQCTSNPTRKLSLGIQSLYTQINHLNNINNQKRVSTTNRNNGYDDENDDYIVTENEIWDRFKIIALIGKGSFGQVVDALDLETNERVAIKIIKNRLSFSNQAQNEIRIVKSLNSKDPNDEKNIVRLKDHFYHRNHLCIVYEKLSMNLYDLLLKTGLVGLPIGIVRKFAHQILVALQFLKQPDVDVIHCDLKPENILLRTTENCFLKVIDFGSSCFSNEKIFSYIQSRFYRSPEVMMGLSYSHQIDMWSFGCLLLELLLGEPLFAGASEHDQMCKICDLLGLPAIELIEKAPKNRISKIFKKVHRGLYRLVPSKGFVPSHTKLIDLLKTKIKNCGSKSYNFCAADYFNFLDLVTRLLIFNPEDRLTPDEALQHPFLKPVTNQYINTDLVCNELQTNITV